MERVVLKAPEGMVYTNGTETGKEIYLAVGMSGEDFHLISEEEYEQAMESGVAADEATESDFLSALSEFGVSV